MLADLKANRFLDHTTRALSVEMTMHNANTGDGLSVRLLVEISRTGDFATFARYLAFGTTPLDSKEVLMLIGVFLGGTLVILDEVIRWKAAPTHSAYFFSIWTVLFWMHLGALIYSCFCHVQFYFAREVQGWNKVLSDHDHFRDMYREALWSQTSADFGGFAAGVAVVSNLWYLKYSKRMMLVINTLYLAWNEILSVFLMLVLTLTAFVLWGNLAFSTYLHDFSTMGITVSTLLRVILGDFDYTSLQVK